MDIKITKWELVDNFNPAHRKEKYYYGSYVMLSKKDCNHIVVMREYHTTSCSSVCIWINSDDVYVSGSGKVCGYGFERTSAAMYEALSNMGIEVSNLSMVGEYAIKKALYLLAEKLGYKEDEICIIRENP